MKDVGVISHIPFLKVEFSLFAFSICSPMGTTGDGLMTAQAAGAVTVHQTTVPSTQHGGLERAVSVSQLDAGDILYNLIQWYRYVQAYSSLYGYSTLFRDSLSFDGCVTRNVWFTLI